MITDPPSPSHRTTETAAEAAALPGAAPPAQSDAAAFAGAITEMTGIKCPTLMPSVAAGLLDDLYRCRWEAARRAERKAIREDRGQPTDWRTVCCISGLPVQRAARVRGFLLVREEHAPDARTEAGYGGEYFERWRPVGLPLPGRYRYADSGIVVRAEDIAWRCLRTYFRQRYRLRLQPDRFLQQLDAATVGRNCLEYPSPQGGGARPWFTITYALEPAYRWLVHARGKGTKELRDRRSFRGMWDRWRRRRGGEIDLRLPFADEGDNFESLLSALGSHTGPRTRNAPYTEDMELLDCLPSASQFLGVPFGLGPGLHAVLRDNRVALRALLDCKLAYAGMGDMGLRLHPHSDARLFTACEFGRKAGGLREELARWARAQWREMGSPDLDRR